MSSFIHALKGLIIVLKSERNFKIQLLIASLVLFCGFYFSISRFEWMIILLHFGLVLSLECFNTFVEHLCDLVHPTYSTKVKHIKDISAGAVLISAVIATVNGSVIFWPYIKSFLGY